MFVSKEVFALVASALIVGLLATPPLAHAAEDTDSSASSNSANADATARSTESAKEAEEAGGPDVYAPAAGESGVDGRYGLNEKVLRERGRRAFGMH